MDSVKEKVSPGWWEGQPSELGGISDPGKAGLPWLVWHGHRAECSTGITNPGAISVEIPVHTHQFQTHLNLRPSPAERASGKSSQRASEQIRDVYGFPQVIK